jgi:hypothetical protein
MDNIEKTEGDIISIFNQIDYILQNLDVEPLPGHVIATLCQSRRYINSLEHDLQFLASEEKWVLQNEFINQLKNENLDLRRQMDNNNEPEVSDNLNSEI